MGLASDQRAIAALLAGREPPGSSDPRYVAELKASPRLAALREVSLWWRAFGVTRYCPLTTAILKESGAFEATVDRFVRGGAVSPFIEELGPLFLAFVAEHGPQAIARDVARLEQALVEARLGKPDVVELEWSVDPRAVLPALIASAPLDRDRPAGRFKITIGPHLPHYFEAEEIVGSG